MINEAAINAVKHGRKYVSQADLFESVEVVIAGKEKKDRIMGPKEKEDRSISRGWSCVSDCIAEKYRAGTEDYNCTAYPRSTRLCYAGAGGRKILKI